MFDIDRFDNAVRADSAVDKGGTEVWGREVGTGVMTGSELKGT